MVGTMPLTRRAPITLFVFGLATLFNAAEAAVTVEAAEGRAEVEAAEARAEMEAAEARAEAGLAAGTAGAEGAEWTLLPGGGDGSAQVAVLSDIGPRETPDEHSVSFLLWTRESPQRAERLRLAPHCPPQRLQLFRPQRRSVVLVHGFGDSARESYMFPVLRDALLSAGDVNVLAVDWAALAAAPWYARAAANTAVAGRALGALLAALVRDQGASLDAFHLLGFSLGAHVAGLAARAARDNGAGRVARVTGLDPAGVLFWGAGPSRRLHRSHARRVHVVHTSGGHLALLQPLGHRDFFPNGGAWPQPGCPLDFAGVCSHRRAYYYYAEALLHPERFQARACSSWDAFRNGSCAAGPALPLTALADQATDEGDDEDDEDTDDGVPAIYFLDTNDAPPFGLPPPPPPSIPGGGPLGTLQSLLGAA